MRFLLVLLLFFFQWSQAYKILVFAPTVGRSVMIADNRLADELAKAGHEVVIFEPDFSNVRGLVKETAKVARRFPLGNFGEELSEALSCTKKGKLVIVIEAEGIKELLTKLDKKCSIFDYSRALETEKIVFFPAWSDNVLEEKSIFEFNKSLYDWNKIADKMCRKVLDDEKVMEKLKSENFDAIFTGQIVFCGHGLAHALGIKVKFMVSSCPMFETVSYALGYSTPYSFIPVHGMQLDPVNSLWDRIHNFYYSFVSLGFKWLILRGATETFRGKYGPNFPDLHELIANTDMTFISTDEFVDIPRPLLPNMIHIGGIGAGDYDNMPLEEEFEREMEKGKKGVIYFSLGTVVNVTILPSVFESLTIVARKFPDYHFIARAEKEDSHARQLAKNVSNLHVFSWIPQPAVLRHPRLKAFITHAGYNSLMETARSGVPIIPIPIMLDQPKNSLAVKRAGWGLPVSKIALKNRPDLLIKALREVLRGQKYKDNAKRIANLIRMKPTNGTTRLLQNTEFTIANGGMKELLTDGRHYGAMKYFNLDILLATFVIYWILKRVIRLVIWLTYNQEDVEKEKIE